MSILTKALYTLIIFMVITFVFFASTIYHSYRSYRNFESALNKQGGILVNYIYTNNFSFSNPSVLKIRVISKNDEYHNYIKKLFKLYSFITGRIISITKNIQDSESIDVLMYVNDGQHGESYNDISGDFSLVLKDFLKKNYGASSNVVSLTGYLENRLAVFSGVPLFFNKEVIEINYKDLISNKINYSLKNSKVNSTVIYSVISKKNIASTKIIQGELRYIITQEWLHAMTAKHDLKDSMFEKKTLLYDADEKLGDSIGEERIIARKKYVPSGLCFNDVAALFQFQYRDNKKMYTDYFNYINLYFKTYYVYYRFDNSIFDNDCW